MAVSTIASTLGRVGGVRDENGVDHTTPIINILNGNRTAEQMIGEYFGLRKEVVYSDDWKEVLDMINEFRNHSVLQEKKVHFVQYFKDKGMTEEMYYKVIPREYVYKPVEKIIPNVTENEQSNNISTTESKGEQPLQNTCGRARKNK